ncbi:hypothetical protein [Microbispora catharanthi]|uniref:Uncharacterized protein n=1 Tax=Microbispora catharanthi TaxID=1712871 RepID=A0A5N6BZT0_9ACTN|nr:hypothetical protein [Microbispora catharanthi]KAB8186008.1 hypothetical protein FH610_009665 [Microbispora catharanthi]
MGNLGKYQDIVTAAKQAGGVDKLIQVIEEAAVVTASPKIFRKGAGAGVLGTLVAGGVVAVAVKRYLGDKKAREALVNEAKEQLKTKVEESMKSDGANLENGEDESDSNGGK